MNNRTQIPNFFIDPTQPGVIRGGWFDYMGGMLAGKSAASVCKMLNGYLGVADLMDRWDAIVDEVELSISNMREPQDCQEAEFMVTARKGLHDTKESLDELAAAMEGERS